MALLVFPDVVARLVGLFCEIDVESLRKLAVEAICTAKKTDQCHVV